MSTIVMIYTCLSPVIFKPFTLFRGSDVPARLMWADPYFISQNTLILMVFWGIIWSLHWINPINDHIISENTIRIYVFWGIKYGSAHTNRAGTSLPRKGVCTLSRTFIGPPQLSLLFIFFISIIHIRQEREKWTVFLSDYCIVRCRKRVCAFDQKSGHGLLACACV